MRSLLRVLLCGALCGCATNLPPPIAFNAAEAEFSRAKGVAVLKGQSFLRRNDGMVVYGAGSDVMLVPKTNHSEQALQNSFGGRKQRPEINLLGSNVLGNDLKLDPGFQPFIRKTKADGQGNFTFENIPPGQYYVLSRVTWCAPSRYGCDQQGGDLMETITVTPTENVVTVLLNGA